MLILSGGDVRQLEQRLFVVFGNGQHPLIGDCRLTMEPPAAKPVSDPEEQVHGVVGRTRPHVQIAQQCGGLQVVGGLTDHLLGTA